MASNVDSMTLPPNPVATPPFLMRIEVLTISPARPEESAITLASPSTLSNATSPTFWTMIPKA
jgi:hypothetical protein